MNDDEQTTRPVVQENPITCANLFKALAAAQGDLINPTKDQDGYNYKYAGLDQVIDILRKVLPAHGLCYIQNPIPAGDGNVSIQTIVGHESGEHISSVLTMPLVENGRNNSAQNYGGTLTYIRRYALTSVFGIATEEDGDAKGKDKPKPKKEAPPPKKEAPPPKKEKPAPKKEAPPPPKKENKLPSELEEEAKLVQQVKQRIEDAKIGEMCAANGYNPEKAAVATNRAFLAQSDKVLSDKLKAFRKEQEKEESA